MNKLKLKHKKFDGCCLGKYKIYSIITHTENEFDIVLEEPNEHIYYSFTFFHEVGVIDDEFYTYRWANKLYGDDYEDLDVEVTREVVGNVVFDSVYNIAIFLVKNGFIKNEKYY